MSMENKKGLIVMHMTLHFLWGDSGSGEERRMSNPEVTGSKPSQSLISVGTQDLDLRRSNLAQCDISNGAICTVPRSVPRNIVPLAHGAC